jgi:ribosomal-protein-alanine N-acetyltransferase
MPLNGKKVCLREVRESDLPLLLALRNDLDTQGWPYALPTDYTLRTYQKQYEEDSFSFERRRARFVIETLDTQEVVGNITYYGLNPRHSVTCGIAIARQFWSAGLAYDAQETLLHFMFEELGVRVVRLWTTGSNEKAIQLAERSGFRIAARRRQAVIRRGELADSVTMDLLREEFYALHPELQDRLPGL